MTNARLTGTSEERICEQLRSLGVLFPMVLGDQWMNQTIAANQSLRMLAPRVYGLGDLSQILDERAYTQSRTFLSYLQGDLSTFVSTSSYLQSVEALRDHGFVLLLGEPAAGKSTIASALAASAIDAWRCSVIVAHDAVEALNHWNPHEPRQLFWVDDAFGSVRHERTMTDEWRRRLPQIMAAVEAGARFVLTSRDYIYKEARQYLKEHSFPPLGDSQIVVSVEDLNRDERKQILYNHLRQGDQTRNFLTWIKPYLDEAATVEPFRPEIARRLGAKRFTKSVVPTRTSVINFMAKPKGFLRDVYAEMDPGQIGALSLVYAAGRLPSPLHLNDQQRETLEQIGCTSSEVTRALSMLAGTFFRYGLFGSGDEYQSWSFRHPTLREGFAAFVVGEPHLLELFLAGLNDASDLSQVDADNSHLSGTLVRIPPYLYRQLAEHLKAIRHSIPNLTAWASYCRFLAYSCSRGFLSLYMEVDPDLVHSLMDFKPLLSHSPEIDVLAKLRTVGLLDEDAREHVLRKIRELTLNYPDASWFNEIDFRLLLDPLEFLAIFRSASGSLIPRLDEILRDWTSRAPAHGDRFEYYRPLSNSLFSFQQVLRSDDSAVHALERALRRIDEITGEAVRNRASGLEYSRYALRATSASVSERSIFDDLDNK
ncbi:hypothetical protein [Streptomyces violaceusniger]|uniref:nSTAND3 domain-containing NTPase n=1 Tax=Streptomyces violaceusniger TaxID=68280 RepID=UPI003830A58D